MMEGLKAFDKDPVSLVVPVSHDSSLLIFYWIEYNLQNFLWTWSFFFRVAPVSKVLSVPGLKKILAAPPAVALWVSSPPGSGRPTLSAVSTIGSTTSVTASLFRGLLQYSCKRHAQRNARTAKLDFRHMQRDEFVASLKARLANKQAQRTAYLSERVALRAASGGLLNHWVPDRRMLSSIGTLDIQLEAEPKTLRAPPPDLVVAVRARSC